ncbi:MAG: GNAT family N-acetyltransferase, partial [Actinobacteria bacterium]|nr:GNAT family N-acetyltransferase [Actinomycetota bacterium]
MVATVRTEREIVDSDPRTDPRWRRLALGPHGSLFTSPPWIEAVCGTYGFDPVCRIVESAGTPLAGLAWVPISDLRGARRASLPFSDRADPPVDDAVSWATLRTTVVGPDAPFTLRCFDTAVPAADPHLERVGSALWHGTALDADVGNLHGRLSKHARRNIALAERAGVRVEACAGLDAVRSFHGLHVQLRKRKYRLLAQPVVLFERIWQAFTDEGAVVTLLARADDELIAGAMFLVWKDTLYYKFGASQPEGLRLRPNDAIFWAGLRWGVARGLHWLDWGLSDVDQPGLVAYKRKWATEERTIVTLRAGGEQA